MRMSAVGTVNDLPGPAAERVYDSPLSVDMSGHVNVWILGCVRNVYEIASKIVPVLSLYELLLGRLFS